MRQSAIAFPPVAAAVMVLAFATEGQGAVRPRVVDTRLPTADVVIASEVLAPPADQHAHMSDTLQTGIDAIAAVGGGVLFLPAGRYRVEKPVTVREGVTVRGEWVSPGEAAPAGTVLAVTAGKGAPDGPPAFTLQRGSGIREVTIWYPEQDVSEVVPYPWTIRTSSDMGGDNVTVVNVTLVNPYQAIRIGPEWNELHTIRRVFGTPLKTGLWIDTTTDIGRVIDVHFSPQWWSASGLPGAPADADARRALATHLASQATGADIGRSDWEYLYALHVDGYAVGVRFRAGERGTTNAVMFGCELRNCGTALVCERLNGVGLSATGCAFHGTGPALLAPSTFTTVAQFHSCRFGSTGASAVQLQGRGLLSFQDCRFEAWRDVAVDASAGSVSVHGSTFEQETGHIRLGEELRRARVLGNRFAGEPSITRGHGPADVQIAHRALGFAKPDVSLPPPAPVRAPASRELFVVTDFRASAEAQDNTASFARALNAARVAGGGTVYVPAGNYRLADGLVVPSGVELRGCFDVPHHTISAGSVLMPLAGRGEEEGPPFLQLERGAGLRGLTVWYPEQDLREVIPYPWAVRALGPDCWLVDVTLGNAYQGADFWTHDSTGHVISYLAGAMLKRGLWVSKSDGAGWVEDVQFNPHYSLRLHKSLPHPPLPGGIGGRVIDYQRQNLEAMVFGRCADEHITRTFLYAAFDGLAFRDDGGATNARIVNHGTDTASRACVLEAAGDRGLVFLNAQLVPLGKWVQAGIVATSGFAGTASFFNSQLWAGPASATIEGRGRVVVQQANTHSGAILLRGSDCSLSNVSFGADLRPHVRIEGDETRARVTGLLSEAGLCRVDNQVGSRARLLGNACALPPPTAVPGAAPTFATGWEEDEPTGSADRIASPGGGRRAVSKATCRRFAADGARTGGHVLRLYGNADDPKYSYVYFRVFDGPVAVLPDTVLSYWVQPRNERGRHVGVDLLFSDGSVLRDSGLRTTDGAGVHTGGAKGPLGEWTRIAIPIGGRYVGKTVEGIMAAYDSRGGGGEFEAWFDDLQLHSELAGLTWQVRASPAGGECRPGTRVTLSAEGGVGIRYTLDGSNLDAGSPTYRGPIVLGTPGLRELRFATETPAGRPSPFVFGEMYDVQE